MQHTIYPALADRISSNNAPAVLAAGRKFLSHRALADQIERTVARLNTLGIGRGDRVAIVLPNGPEAAVCCLAVASGAVAAPINAGLTAVQLRDQLQAIRAQAVIVQENDEGPCVEVARDARIPLLRLRSRNQDAAGVFALNGERRAARDPGFATDNDVALLMSTSGSTSRPKLAPLTHRNVLSGSANNASHLGLTAEDRCLCVTPMFFTQGILVSVFSSLLKGGSVVCTPGYDPSYFFDWLDEFHPTWYAAPTAVQHSILSRAALHAGAVERSRLRVIRCSSAHAGSDLITRLEQLFRAPVLDSYGLTETSSTIVGEPLPPARRKPGSVGIPVGCEIAIAGEDGRLLGTDEIGEVIVRGPAVIRGYEAAEPVNRDSFFKDWLRTGDLGRIDAEGYVFLTGRIKELINRGGEKISPVEIDGILCAHPAVAEAITFAMPHPRLGEEIAAAVVLRGGFAEAPQLETELQEFVSARLTDRRTPRRIVFVPEIPRTATGKTIRVGLAERLGLPDKRDATAPRVENVPSGITEMLLMQIWEEILGRAGIGLHDDFFDAGGDSLLAARLMVRIEKTFRAKLPVTCLFQAPTVAKLALLVAGSGAKGYDFGPSHLIEVRTSGSQPPLIILGLQPLFRELIQRIPEDFPIYGLSFPATSTLTLPFSIEEIAARQVEALRRFRPNGAYMLAGWCADGVMAFEIAQQVRAQGGEVPLVAMIDSFNPETRRSSRGWKARLARARYHGSALSGMSFDEARSYLLARASTFARKIRQGLWRWLYRLNLRFERRVGDRLRLPDQIVAAASQSYSPRPYEGRVIVFRAQKRPAGVYSDAAGGWGGIVRCLEVIDVPGDHRDMFLPPNVDVMAAALNSAIEIRVQVPPGSMLSSR